MTRRRARELALSALFQWDVAGQDPLRALGRFVTEEDLPQGSQDFAMRLVEGTLLHQEEIDAEISRCLEDWRFERLANVDRNVLRIAVFELEYVDSIPLSVSINEAVEIAKLFGGPDSGKFVNGVLGRIAKHLLESMAAPGARSGQDGRPGDALPPEGKPVNGSGG